MPRRVIACGVAGLDFQTVIALGKFVDGDLLDDGNELLARLEKLGRWARTAVDFELAGVGVGDAQLELDVGGGTCAARHIHFKVGKEWIVLFEGRIRGGREFHSFADQRHELRGKNALRVGRRIDLVEALAQSDGAKIEWLFVVAFYSQGNVNTAEFLAVAEDNPEVVLTRRQIHLGFITAGDIIFIVITPIEIYYRTSVSEWRITRTTGLVAEARCKSSILAVHPAEYADGGQQVPIPPFAIQRVPRKLENEMHTHGPGVGKEQSRLSQDGDFRFPGRERIAFHLLTKLGSFQWIRWRMLNVAVFGPVVNLRRGAVHADFDLMAAAPGGLRRYVGNDVRFYGRGATRLDESKSEVLHLPIGVPEYSAWLP